MILASKTVNVNAKTAKGTALHIAVKKKAKNMIPVLIDFKADPNIRDRDNKSAFELTRDSEIQVLLEKSSLHVANFEMNLY